MTPLQYMIIVFIGLALVLAIYYGTITVLEDSVNLMYRKYSRPDIEFGYIFYSDNIILGVVNHDPVDHLLTVNGTCIVNISVSQGVYFTREYSINIPLRINASSYNYTIINVYDYFNIPREYNVTVMDVALTVMDNESGYAWLGASRLPEAEVVVVDKSVLGRTIIRGDLGYTVSEATLVALERDRALAVYGVELPPRRETWLSQLANISLGLDVLEQAQYVNYSFSQGGRILVYQGVVLRLQALTPYRVLVYSIGDSRRPVVVSSKNFYALECGIVFTTIPWLYENPLASITPYIFPYNSTVMYAKTVLFAGKYCLGDSSSKGFVEVDFSNIYPVVIVLKREP